MLPLAVQNKTSFAWLPLRALVARRQLGGLLRYRRDEWVTRLPQPVAGHAADHPVCAGVAASILPFGALGRTRGRKAAFRLGTGAGMVTGLAAALAVVLNSFLLFCLAAMHAGAYAAVALGFSFCRHRRRRPARRARALSLVMGGGVAAGIIGPMLVTGTMHLWPAHTFAVTFLAQALVAGAGRLFVERVTPAEPTAASVRGRAVAARDCPPAGFCHYRYSAARWPIW